MKNYLKALGYVFSVVGALATISFLLVITRFLFAIPLIIFGAAFLVKEDLDDNDRWRKMMGSKWPKETK